MNNFVRNVKEHKAAAVICLLLLAALITVTVFVMKDQKSDTELSSDDTEDVSQSTEKLLFADSSYPVKVVTENDGTLSVELDGSASPDITWAMIGDDSSDTIIKAENSEEKEGLMTCTISPVSVGYATLGFSRSGEVKGIKYNAVVIDIDVYVSADKDGNQKVSLSDARISTSSAGGLDSDTPYLLDGDRVVLPNGGDWVLEAKLADGAPKGLFNIYRLQDVDGLEYYAVDKDITLLAGMDAEKTVEILKESRLVLSSESLGIEQELECTMSEERKWVLSVYDPEKNKQTEESSDDE